MNFSNQDFENKTVLLVEDELLLAYAEETILKKYALKVITARTGEKALELVRSNPEIDLVLMDINLGKGIDGTEAAKSILQEFNLPIVFLSSHTDPEIVEKTEEITSYGYVVKDSGETVLMASIKMAFKLFNAHNKMLRQEKELRESEKALRKANDLFREIYEEAGVGVAQIHSQTGRFIQINRKYSEIIGFAPEEIKAKNFLEAFW